MSIDDNICYMFNRIYLNLMKEIKDKDPDIKQCLKESYKVFDKKSSEYLATFVAQFDDSVKNVIFIDEGDDLLSHEAIYKFTIFNKVPVSDIMSKVVKDDVESKNSLMYYVYLLFVLGYIYKLSDMDDGKKDILFRKSVQCMNTVESSELSDEQLEEQLEDILDEDIKKVLRKIHRDRSYAKQINISVSDKDAVNPDSTESMDFLQNTKIGELAKEISESIDMTKLGINGGDGGGMMPEDAMNPNVLSGIIQTVGSKITEKMTSGELNQEELMSEALSMMGKMNDSGHGDMMSNMMGMMSGMMGNGMMDGMMGGMNTAGGGATSSSGGGGSGDSNKTRGRLRKKLELKNK